MPKTPNPAAPETADKEQQLAELANLIAEHQHAASQLKEEAGKHEAQVRQYEDQVRKVLGTFARDVPAGSLKIDWTAPRRSFDLPSFVAAYPPSKNPHMYKTVTTPYMDMVPPKLKNNFMLPGQGDGTVKVK